jgi:penicillin amidase
MKLLLKIVVSILMIFVVILGGAYYYLKSAAPEYEGKKTLKALHERVEVVFDEYAVPHIYAQNEEDAYFALGYVHAQERLFQMEMLRRVSEGKLSEILGKDLLEVDKSMRFLGMKEMGERNAAIFQQNKNEKSKSSTLAYLDGINTFIEEDNLPIEFKLIGFSPQKFEVKDIYSIISYMAFGFTSALKEDPLMSEIQDKLGDQYMRDFRMDSTHHAMMFHSDGIEKDYLHHIAMAKDRLDAALPVPVWQGSNSWAISGQYSASGKVLLANDTHIPYSQPSVWYEAYMEYPDHQLYGYYLGGVPHAIMGHNDQYAWGLTIFPLDQFDLYREKINPQNPNQYWHFDHWQDFSSQKEIFKVKDMEEVVVEKKYNHHGPIVDGIFSSLPEKPENSAISLWWIINHIDTQVMSALYLLDHAQNLDSFEEAVSKVDLLGLNIVYGDRSGNIAYWSSGLIPKRPEHINPLMIIDGSKIENELLGYYPFDKNPKTINPESGMIVTANNPPKVVDSIEYPGYYAPGYRAKRIEDLLSQTDKWDLESMKKVQLDVHSDRDIRLIQLILSQLDPKTKEKASREIRLLEDWDGNYDIHSVAAGIYTQIIYYLLKETMIDELGEDAGMRLLTSFPARANLEKLLSNKNSPWWDNLHTPGKETRQQIITTAFNQAIANLYDKYGQDIQNWEWGLHHTLDHIHPIGRKKPFDKIFNVGTYAKNGGMEVVDKENFKYNSSGEYKVLSGPAMRLLIDFANPAKALGIIPTGQSGNIMSPHYADQAEMFVNGEYRTQYTNKQDIKKKKTLLLMAE